MRPTPARTPPPPTPAQTRLVAPSARWRDSYIAALEEGFRRGARPAMRPREIAEVRRAFDRHLAERMRQTGEIILPGGRRVEGVPVSLFWLVAGDAFIGEMSFRHHLNDYLRLSGGHVGYGVRPSLMGRGFGKRLLALAKAEARARGLAHLLVTCHDDNHASARVIEANGGELEDVIDDIFGGGPLRRYWIALGPPP
ncbi:MAG: GNAT family N-acetyltransferase [Alphaproteobacteria bacterium]